jgi:hypothetical protein
LSHGFSQTTRQAAYELFTPNKSGQRSRPTSYRGCWHVVGRRFFCPYRHNQENPATSSELKEVYNPKAVIPHAASLHQASAHCAIFPTAASRRSLGRVSVPVWPVALSGRLPVVALVGHHPTNKLIGREPIPDQKPFPPHTMRHAVISGISPRFRGLSQSPGQVTHVLLTRSPLEYPQKGLSARLACVKHAASVRPEPGSNSPTKTWKTIPATKNLLPQQTWHWHHKHPVEFSKNNHTPKTNRPSRRPALGALVQLYCPARALSTGISRFVPS